MDSRTRTARALFNLLALLILSSAVPVFGSTATLAWDPNTESDLAGYKLYYGTVSQTYTASIDVGNVTTYTLSSLSPATYYFAVTAYNTAGEESGFSNEISKTIGVADTTPPAISAVSSSNVTSGAASISWTTNEASDSQVEYGTTTAYGSSTTLNTSLVTSHSQTLSGLTASRLYNYRVKSRDAAGNLAVSANFTFTTAALPDTTQPTLTIASPTSNATYNASASPVTLGGTASDNIAVTQITWVNSRGGSGTASGTTSWTASNISLQSGANIITVTAGDAAGNTRSAVLTVNYANSSKADMIAPASGSTLSAAPVTFTWNSGTGVSQYWLYVGTSTGGSDIHAGNMGKNLSATINTLPADGRSLYVRLWSQIGSTWQHNDYTYKAYQGTSSNSAKADITSPANGSTLASTSVTFNWGSGTGVTQYWLYIGNTAGASDIYSADQGTNLSVTVIGLPSDGRTLYVRLRSLINGSWEFNDYTYKAHQNASVNTGSTKADMTSPANGATLGASSVTFGWTSGTGVSQYWLSVGNATGGSDIYSANQGNKLSVTINALPVDGRNLNVRLWSQIGTTWQHNDYTYKAYQNTAAGAKADMISPANGSTLASSSVNFSWSSGTGVTQYWLSIGTSVGSTNIFNAGQGTSLSATVNTLPVDGGTFYVRLWSQVGSSWLHNDYTYKAHQGTSSGVKATIIGPANGSTLTSSNVNFTWGSGTGVSEYWLYVGSQAGTGDIYNASQGTNLSVAISGLPTDGRSLYVRLQSLINGSWEYNDYTYKAYQTTSNGSAKAEMITFANGSILPSSSVDFTWSGGTGVTQYWLTVGYTFNGSEIYSADQKTNQWLTVTGIPTDGRAIYVRLWSLINGTWHSNDYVFKAAQQ